MLAKLCRVIIAARFLPTSTGRPTDAEIRAVHQTWASASDDLAREFRQGDAPVLWTLSTLPNVEATADPGMALALPAVPG